MTVSSIREMVTRARLKPDGEFNIKLTHKAGRVGVTHWLRCNTYGVQTKFHHDVGRHKYAIAKAEAEELLRKELEYRAQRKQA